MSETKLVNGRRVPLTEAEIAQRDQDSAEHQKRLAEHEKVKYRDERVRAYPSIGDQLDMLYKAMDRGEIPKSKEFYNAIKAVKDAYPKPTEGSK